MRRHQGALRVGPEVGILGAREDQRRRAQNPDAAAPILAGSGVEPCLPGVRRRPEHVCDAEGLRVGIQGRSDILAHESLRLPPPRLRIRVDPGAHPGTAVLGNGFGARRRARDQDQVREAGQARRAILGPAREGQRHLGPHAVAGDPEARGLMGTDHGVDVVGHRVDRDTPSCRRLRRSRADPPGGTSAFRRGRARAGPSFGRCRPGSAGRTGLRVQTSRRHRAPAGRFKRTRRRMVEVLAGGLRPSPGTV